MTVLTIPNGTATVCRDSAGTTQLAAHFGGAGFVDAGHCFDLVRALIVEADRQRRKREADSRLADALARDQ